MESDVPLIRQDTPQLTLHNYRRWQYSPALSTSPELDYRRVRRKPSIQNLTGRSAHSAFSWTPSSIPPLPIDSFSARDSPLQLQQPSTPRPRTYTASPSLSSTITTLQSTPTHTPILRGSSLDERRSDLGQGEPGGPIGTKRKYPPVQQPRRFPRRPTDGHYRGAHKVYAAVFDLPPEQGGPSKQPNISAKHQLNSRAALANKRDRTVRFAEFDSHRDNHIINRHDSINSSTGSEQPLHRCEQNATSSFSLSKFEFPAPPNKDNWAGALGMASNPSSYPSTTSLLTIYIHRPSAKIAVRYCPLPWSIV